MTDKQIIFLTWLVIFAVAFMSMVAVQEHVHQDKQIEVSYIGSIGSVHIYDRPLTVEEISLHFCGNGDYVDVNTTDGTWITVNQTYSTDRVYRVSSYKVFSSENYTQSEQNAYDNESRFIVDVPYPIKPTFSISPILDSHGFYEWSESDQELLTQMMQVTAAGALGIETEITFGELASIAPIHVLETYIDLLESAGY